MNLEKPSLPRHASSARVNAAMIARRLSKCRLNNGFAA